MKYAHSLPGYPTDKWELLADHLRDVGKCAAEFGTPFGATAIARAAGLLHDIGKCSVAFQRYIGAGGQAGEGGRGSVDHSTAGAREAARRYPGPLGRLLAFGIAGHHAGLADAAELDRRLAPKHEIPDYTGWEAHAGSLPDAEELTPPDSFRRGPHRGFSQAFLVRMVFSCLVDADFLETERFYTDANGETRERGNFPPIAELAGRLRTYLDDLRASAKNTDINRLRAEVLEHATAKAALPPDLFTLTVPTGGGKTLTSLSFALEHAVRHGLRRVVYVIPFTSIIEQTAQVFREALDPPGTPISDSCVLEHHASFDWEAALKRPDNAEEADAGEGPDGLAKLRRAAENWDALIIVTTAVQFFESLFANRTSRCRKLHNLVGSVIILDEAQTLPIHLLRPCLAALDELCRNYGASIVLCTATQPALRRQDEFKLGLDIPPERELAPNPPNLYSRLKRVTVERIAEPVADAEIAVRFGDQSQMLCVVNSRRHAYDLFQRLRGLDLGGTRHLTTLMCPRHRRQVLAEVRQRLKDELPVRLVATSLIEAGVNIDFPEVWRAIAGLDQIAQAAGRCNREGSRISGRVVVFEPADHKPPKTFRAFQQTAEAVLRRHADPLCLDAVCDYFRHLYWIKGEAELDAAKLDGQPFPILASIGERASRWDFPFRSVAGAFRMIDEAMEPVIVPWDEDAHVVLARVAAMDRPLASDLRTLQQYTVNVPPKNRNLWLADGVLTPAHPALGEALLRFADDAFYDPEIGLRLFDSTRRSAEDNLF
jgi:CRISPR-associated endonuclease/helicase Cas3